MENQENTTNKQEAPEKPQKRIKKHEASGDKKPITSLYDLVGVGRRKNIAANIEEYSEKLGRMDLADLQDHAMEQGLIPIDDRDRMIDRLEKQFIIDNGMDEASRINGEAEASEQKKVEDTALKILKRGR